MAIKSFPETDLTFVLKQYGIDHVVLAEMRANTGFESTALEAFRLGHHTSVVTDAVGTFKIRELSTALEIDYPVVSHNVLTTREFLEATK